MDRDGRRCRTRPPEPRALDRDGRGCRTRPPGPRALDRGGAGREGVAHPRSLPSACWRKASTLERWASVKLTASAAFTHLPSSFHPFSEHTLHARTFHSPMPAYPDAM